MVCRDFILPEPASYVFFYAVFNLRNLLYIIRPRRLHHAIVYEFKIIGTPMKLSVKKACHLRLNGKPFYFILFSLYIEG